MPQEPLKFDEEIAKLAQQARQDHPKPRDPIDLRKKRRLSPLIKAGLALIGLELAMLAAFYAVGKRSSPQKAVPPPPIASRQDCSGAVYRTYWKVVRFLKDHGHTPANLAELVGDSVKKLPVDPATGRALDYWTDGYHFSVDCPKPPVANPGAR